MAASRPKAWGDPVSGDAVLENVENLVPDTMQGHGEPEARGTSPVNTDPGSWFPSPLIYDMAFNSSRHQSLSRVPGLLPLFKYPSRRPGNSTRRLALQMTRSPSPQPAHDATGPPPKGRKFPAFLRPATSLASHFTTDSDLRYRHKMWDVVWTDPKKESRKEHRERKATKQARSEKGSSKSRSIFSRGSSSSSDGPSLVSFSSRKNGGKSLASVSTTASSIHTSTTAANFDLEADGDSNFDGSYEATPRRVARSFESTLEESSLPEEIEESTEGSLNQSKRDGIIYSENLGSLTNHQALTEVFFQKPVCINEQYALPPTSPLAWSTQAVERVALEPCHIVQTLSEGSFIARSTEVTTTLRTTPDEPIGLSSEVTITANSETKVTTRPRSAGGQSHLSLRGFRSRSPVRPPPLPSLPRRVPSSNVLLRSDNSDGWKPPDAWACTPTTETSGSNMDDVEGDNTEEPEPSEASFPVEQTAMQREVKRLAAESNIIRLLRLKEVWSMLSSPNSRKDLEVEKTQWMLSALYNMDQTVDPEENLLDDSQDITRERTKRVLALYETPAATSYIAAVYYTRQVYHLSSAPLSHTLFPNIHPVLVPVRSSSAFPMASSSFEAVYSLRLPLSTPSQEIPGLLRNIHRCLEPDGALHLVLIDPLPIASTLGPLLRAWIEHHLLLNLETNFRCMNPSKLFPIWLENALLRVDYETAATTRFSAIPFNQHQMSLVENSFPSEEAIKQELRNLVGRMLWMEVWAEYIDTDTWWWEDADIIAECNKLQTTWEWRIMTAYKDG
ncbi:hypothetical protein FALBO_14089 [Fusarium albosuccineum]|uniref:Methyltransferase type 11 domain-containing protein n=1 Tax=Fusarium albosuccineum TaxID=1237068 RepID=A0A8H4L0U8_9HYPO|nr:hypothetical protein FALBO_14089 [Fusarium albosuccineum]